MTTKQKNPFFSKICLFYPKNWEEKGKIVKIHALVSSLTGPFCFCLVVQRDYLTVPATTKNTYFFCVCVPFVPPLEK